MRKAAPRGLDVVPADGDVEPAVPVHVAEARMAVVGVLVAHAHLLRHFTKHVPRRHPHDLDHVVLGIARHAHVGTLHRCWVTRLPPPFANRCRVVEPEGEPPEAVLREHPFHRIAGCRRRFFAGDFAQPQITARPLQQHFLRSARVSRPRRNRRPQVSRILETSRSFLGRGRETRAQRAARAQPARLCRLHFAHPDAVAVETETRTAAMITWCFMVADVLIFLAPCFRFRPGLSPAWITQKPTLSYSRIAVHLTLLQAS